MEHTHLGSEHPEVEEPKIQTVTPDTKLLTVSVVAAYNVVLIALVLFMLNVCLQDILTTGSLNFRSDLFWWTFSSTPNAIFLWTIMMISMMLMYACFRLWALQRERFSKEGRLRILWDRSWFVALVFFFSSFMVLPCVAVFLVRMSPTANMAVLAEQIRLLMKAYAYIRTQVASVLAVGIIKSTAGSTFPSRSAPNWTFSHFMYFLFAPTLVYQDEYRRTAEVKKMKVLRHFLELIVGSITTYMIFVRCVCPLIPELLSHPDQNKALGLTGPLAGAINWLFMMVRVTPPAIFITLMLFYLIFNAMQMIFAEVMRFQDRRFYMDWWNVSSFKMWYRAWNLLVQRWLYRYVFLDLKALGCSNMFIRGLIFFFSAVIHEYIITFGMFFFYPVMYVMFGICGFIMSYVPSERYTAAGNTLVLFGFFFGAGIMMTSYSIEYLAREHCPRILASWLDIFVPRSWFCSHKFNEAEIVTS